MLDNEDLLDAIEGCLNENEPNIVLGSNFYGQIAELTVEMDYDAAPLATLILLKFDVRVVLLED